MRRSIRLAALLSVAVAGTALAQPGMQVAPRAEAPGAPAAKLLLANTGELALTDAQVVRLAAIARRSEARRASLRSAMDSARRRFEGQPVDTAARRQFRQRIMADVQRAREQSQVDQRDAIAVLTPDQQAKAWQMVANRGNGMRGGNRGMGMRRGIMRDGGGVRAPRAPRGMRPMREPMMRGDRPVRAPRPPQQ
jgi:Spy/CpxP family protein refolding chaperone